MIITKLILLSLIGYIFGYVYGFSKKKKQLALTEKIKALELEEAKLDKEIQFWESKL